MKKILILGAGGMAGHVMAEYLTQKPEYEIVRCARRTVTPDTILLDVTEFSHVDDVLGEQRPDIVINCVGMLTVVPGSVGSGDSDQQLSAALSFQTGQ